MFLGVARAHILKSRSTFRKNLGAPIFCRMKESFEKRRLFIILRAIPRDSVTYGKESFIFWNEWNLFEEARVAFSNRLRDSKRFGGDTKIIRMNIIYFAGGRGSVLKFRTAHQFWNSHASWNSRARCLRVDPQIFD